MCALYLEQVGGHKPCEPEFGYVHMSPFGTVYWFAMTMAVGCTWLTRGHPGLSPNVSLSEWLEECHGQYIGFVGTPLVHQNGSARPWIPWCGYSILTSAECVFNLSIATPADMGPVCSQSLYGSIVIMIT